MPPKTPLHNLPPLYFFHIPKTAGTSVRFWLFDLYGKENWLPASIVQDLAKFSLAEINSYRLYSGHFGHVIHDYLDHPPLVVTWLRDPVAQVVSTYFYIVESHDVLLNSARQHGRQDWVDYYTKFKESSLADWCLDPNLKAASGNLQTRMLAKNWPECADRHTICDEPMLEAAKQNLANMFCFGLCESMEASIDLLCDKLAIPPRPLPKRLNSGKSSFAERLAKLSDKDLAAIHDVITYDLRLYEFARELFEQRVSDFLRSKGVTIPSENLLRDYGREPWNAAIRQAIDGDARKAA